MSKKQVKRYVFETDCTRSDAESIIAMQDVAVKITPKTFASKVDREEWSRLKNQLGFDRYCTITHNENCGYIGFYRSVYRGKPCCYIEHSRIEHVFVRPDA